MTVSKVLRDAPDISAATKARIRKIANEMGYVPDSHAQALRTRTTRLFGVVVSNAANPLVAPILVGLEQRAALLGYDVLLAHCLNEPEREERCIRKLIARRVDGLFIAPVYRLAPTAPVYDELLRNQIPTVLIGHRSKFCEQFPCIETSDVEGSFAMTRHLIELGHRRIAFFGGPQETPWAAERLEGYSRALREAEIQLDEKLIFAAGASIEDGERVAEQFLNESTGATAIQAAGDPLAIGAACRLQQRGICIPGDVSVTGFGNLLIGRYFNVPLTTVRQFLSRLGEAAVDLMSKRLRGMTTEKVRLPAELIVRSSSAPPPNLIPPSHATPT